MIPFCTKTGRRTIQTKNSKKTSFVVAWDQTAIAGSVPCIGFQARMTAIESCRRAVVFDDIEVCEKVPGC